MNPDIILINSHGLKNDSKLKIPGYCTYQINSTNSISDGSAIAVRYNVQHKLKDDFITDFLAVELQTTLGPIMVATTYLPPRRPYLPYPDMYSLLNNSIPTYIIGDFNGSHRYFGNSSNNTVGKSLSTLMDQGNLLHLGPHFSTFISHRSATSPDKIFSNKQHYLNYYSEPGNITTSDHIPIIFHLSTKPYYIKQEEKYEQGRADWQLFKTILDNKFPPDNQTVQNNITIIQLEQEMNTWMNNIKEAMDRAIPKSSYKISYQMKPNAEIKRLEYQYNLLQKRALTQGWTLQNYSAYIKIRTELRESCKKACNKEWEGKIKEIISNHKNTKTFWSKINRLRGKNITHTNYLEDDDGGKYYTDQEKCHIMEKNWKDIFRITDEDNATFDHRHSDHIEAYIHALRQRTLPYNDVDLTRLETNNFYERKINKD